jgi:Ni/Co efflux regulator RcnB
LQIFGFSNAELTEAYARASSMKTAEQKIQARRTALLDLHFLAKSNNDFEMMNELRTKIADYNESYPSYKISGDTLARSYRGHMQRIRDSVDGVYLNKKLKRQLIEEYGE